MYLVDKDRVDWAALLFFRFLCRNLGRVAAGQYKMVDGELKATSLDCYLAMELGEDGDLFNLRHAPCN